MSYTILIVDDSNVVRNRIGRSSTSSNFTVVGTASNGLEALEQYKKHKPDLVTMDLTMPKVDGLECIKQIRALNKDTKILVVSALSDRATGLKSLQYGARGFICKPFTDDQLILALSKLVSH